MRNGCRWRVLTHATKLLMLGIASSGYGPSDLERAFQKWTTANVTNYTVESRLACFCGGHLLVWNRLRVQNDVIVEAVPLDGSGEGGQPSLEGWMTVDQLFRTLRSPQTGGLAMKRSVTYDPDLGYPRKMTSECVDPRVADCGWLVEMRDLKRLP